MWCGGTSVKDEGVENENQDDGHVEGPDKEMGESGGGRFWRRTTSGERRRRGGGNVTPPLPSESW
jgi:hypothetical protein